MMRLDQGAQPVALDVGIDLRRRDIGVAEHLLDAAEIGAVIEQMAGEGMAQDMRRDARRIDARLDRERLEELAAAPPRQMALRAARREEEGRGRALGEKGAAHSGIRGERGARRRAQRHQTLLAALAGDEEEALLPQPRQLQGDELGDAQPGGVEQLDEADQPLALGAVPAARSGDQRRDLRLVEDLRQRPAEAGRIEPRRRSLAAYSLREEGFVELPPRPEAARRRATAPAPAAHPRRGAAP